MARMSQEPLIVGRVIGEVLDSFTTSMKMTVSYNKKQVFNGHEFFPSTINIKPKVEIDGGDMRSFFTLIFQEQQMLHLVGKEVVSYEIPKPNIGIHRFVFVLFKQKSRDSVTITPSSRDHFNTRNFASQNNLGLPVAAVYFNAQRETAARRR
ncbi:hypothetical protein TSUD_339430 [Trifolium subterraneum]|nr:hypothetical protein TSUD_339430 [Trifolium subterraneum]